MAHRFTYELERGPIRDGLVIDHRCRRPGCVRPDHLEAVTNWENVRRSPHAPTAVNSRKTECMHGHVLNAENTYHYRGSRYCCECRRIRKRQYARRKGAA